MASNAVRIHDSFLARAEKRALIFLAEHMPGWVNSDHLTVLGLLSMLAAGLAYWQSGAQPLWLWAVDGFIILNWFGDSLDGTLARVRNKQRPRYGYYVDHVVDAISAVFLFGGLGLSGYMHPFVAVALLIAYLLLSIESYLATYARNQFRISHFGFGPTELRILLIVGNLFLLDRPIVDFFGTPQRLFDVGGVIGAAGMLVVLLLAIARNTAALYREETH